MIPAGVQGYGASMPVDFRKGATGSMALVQDWGSTHSATLYVFRSKRADRIKAVWWDGSGVCLFAKTLEEISSAGGRLRRRGVQLKQRATARPRLARVWFREAGKIQSPTYRLEGAPKGPSAPLTIRHYSSAFRGHPAPSSTTIEAHHA